MSMEYEFALKKKGQKIVEDNIPILVWYSTSVAGELVSEVLPFYSGIDEEKDPEYSYYKPCTAEDLDAVFNYARENLQSLDKHIEKINKEIEDYKVMLPKAENVEIYHKIREAWAYAESDIQYAEEEKSKYNRIFYDFLVLKGILEDNKANYEIVRYCG